MTETFDNKENPSRQNLATEPEAGKLPLENMGVPPRPANDITTKMHFGDLALSNDSGGPKENEDKDSPQEASQDKSDDIKLKKDLIGALQMLFQEDEILGDINKDGLLTKTELDKVQVNSQPHKSQLETLKKHFTEVAPEGSLAADEAGQKIKELKREISNNSKNKQPTPDKTAQELETTKKFIIDNGQDPLKAVNDTLANNTVLFIASPAGTMLPDIFNAKPGTRLALAELPSSLRQVFDKFNKSAKGSDFTIPDSLLEQQGGAEGLARLQEYLDGTPNYNELFKSIRDSGGSIVPVGDMTPYGDLTEARANEEQQREQHIKDDVLALWSEDKSKPVLVVGMPLHGARAYEGVNSFKSASLLLNRDAKFKEAGGKVKTFDTIQFDPDSPPSGPTNPYTIARDIPKPLCVSTRINDKPTAAGKLRKADTNGLHEALGLYNEDAYDFIILRPAPR